MSKNIHNYSVNSVIVSVLHGMSTLLGIPTVRVEQIDLSGKSRSAVDIFRNPPKMPELETVTVHSTEARRSSYAHSELSVR